MRLRSLLFVPGDRPERFAKAEASGADALILDLEDSVTATRKAAGREAISARLRAPRSTGRLFVRVNPIDGDFFDDDTAALAGNPPDGIVLPKAEGAVCVAAARKRLNPSGLREIPILPIATETPAAVFELGTYRTVASGLLGVTWGAEDLPAAIGAMSSREEDGRYTSPYEVVRALTLFGAHAAGVPAIETVFPAFRDLTGLKTYAARGARDGFSGMMAIHPDQVAAINLAFTPSNEAVERARAIVDAFESNPGVGALQVDGRMVDAPHLKQARAVLDRSQSG